METNKNIPTRFKSGLERLGFKLFDDSLFLTEESKNLSDPEITFHIYRAKEFNANAVFLRKQLNGSYKPQIYLYDFTSQGFHEKEQAEIQKKIWSSGEVPLACLFYSTEITILDCTKAITDKNTPTYLERNLRLIGIAHELYNEQFAIKIKTGLFWEEEENKKKFNFKNSSYEKLIENIRHIIKNFKEIHSSIPNELINKIIIQSILIKYLEERIDNQGNKLLSDKFFKKYDGAVTFNDVLRRKGKFAELLDELNDKHKGFNGNVFYWKDEEKRKLQTLDISILADLLDTNVSFNEKQLNLWRYFEFKYIPVELISRLYEEFLTGNEEKGKKGKKREEGIYYTPSHLVKLLVDEALPLKKYKEINLETYRVLDPACGSGIFLVTVFKRLVQIWRLQNNMKYPDLVNLKKILRNIYGIDKEEQAVRLTSFSLCLALCNELEPLEIINKLKFDDLLEDNIIYSDFFSNHKLRNKKFDLIIGNPPFKKGAIKNYSQNWVFEDESVKIPQGQIALKFLSDSFSYLTNNGLVCLIIKASGLLYNTTSENYKTVLFSKLNVIQILDFTALARNKSLWENGADVATSAIFIRNQKPNFNKNILHLTFRRTKATKDRIVFEIDDYDLHFVNRQTAIDNNFIWKNNLLGGGRIKTVLEKFKNVKTFKEYLNRNDCISSEGYIVGTKGKLNPEHKHIFDLQTLPTEAITEQGIDYSRLDEIDKNLTFVQVPNEKIFKAPNIIIWENMGEEKLPVFFNKKSFSFKDKLIGISSNKADKNLLKSIVRSFEKFSDFYRFYIYTTSSQVLVNLNTALLKADIMALPYIENQIELTEFDYNVIKDVNLFMQKFIRSGEGSLAVKPISSFKFEKFITNYGLQFSKVLNLIYEDKGKQFRLSEVVTLDNSFIATVFKYDNIKKDTIFHNSNKDLKLDYLSDNEISKHLSIQRIIKLYPQKDMIVFIKPNQYRYWLSLTAYRDADKCFADLSRLGY